MRASALPKVLFLWTILSLNCGGSLATPPPAGDWTVQDDYGNTCMRLSFAAQYIVNGQGFHNHVVNILPGSSAEGDCSSPSRYVDFYPDWTNSLWKLRLGFKLNGAAYTYAMTQVYASWPDGPESQDPISSWLDSPDFLKDNVTIGKAYTCADDLTVYLGDTEVYIWDMHLQPFAEDAGGDFGPEQRCGEGPKPTEAGAPVVIIACSVVGGVLFLALVATVAVIVFVFHRKRRAYTSIQG